MKASRRMSVRSNQPNVMTGLGFLGNRHQPDLWKRLLPSARAQLVADGLFNEDGSITPKGMSVLKEHRSKPC